MTYELNLLSHWALLLLFLFILPACSAYYDYAMPQPLIVPTVALAGAVAIEDQMETSEQDDQESSFLELAYDVIRTPGYVLGYGIGVSTAAEGASPSSARGLPVPLKNFWRSFRTRRLPGSK